MGGGHNVPHPPAAPSLGTNKLFPRSHINTTLPLTLRSSGDRRYDLSLASESPDGNHNTAISRVGKQDMGLPPRTSCLHRNRSGPRNTQKQKDYLIKRLRLP